jgi:hypothetical protein
MPRTALPGLYCHLVALRGQSYVTTAVGEPHALPPCTGLDLHTNLLEVLPPEIGQLHKVKHL